MTSVLSQLSPASVPATLWSIILIAKATLVLLLAIIGAAALRRASASVRHMVWSGALAAVVLLPALSRWSQWRIAMFPVPLGAATGTSVQPDPGLLASPGTLGESSTPALQSDRRGSVDRPARSRHDVVNPATGAMQSRSVVPASSGDTHSAAPAVTAESRAGTPDSAVLHRIGARESRIALAVAWVIGMLALLARLAVGMTVVSRIVRRARPLDGRAWVVPLREVADRLGLARTPRLLCSDEVAMPFACGFLRPAVVLPSDADEWSDDRRRAVLFHELAHVRRRDLFAHMLGRVACAIYWFHPLVWAAARRLRCESERACDDLVLASGTPASDYAHHLLEIVTGARSASAPAPALAMARRREFEGRMLAILDPDQKRTTPGRLQSAAMVIAMAALTLSVSAMAPANRDRTTPVAGSVTPDRDSAVVPVRTSRRAATPEETTATVVERDLAASARDTGEVRHPRTVERIVSAAVESSTERAVEEFASRIAGATLGGLLSDWDYFVPRWNSRSLAGSNAAIRASIRESLRGQTHGAASSSPADSGTTELLVKLLQNDSDAKVRRTAAWALAQRDERDARAVTAALASALAHDRSADVREMAAWGLGQGVSDTAVQALRDAVRSDSDERVKTTAASALGQIRDPESLAALSHALSTERDHRIREAELRALIMLGEASDSTLQKLLDSPDPDVRLKVTRAIIGVRGVNPWPWPMPMPRPMPRGENHGTHPNMCAPPRHRRGAVAADHYDVRDALGPRARHCDR